jgi:hypothetical protein
LVIETHSSRNIGKSVIKGAQSGVWDRKHVMSQI